MRKGQSTIGWIAIIAITFVVLLFFGVALKVISIPILTFTKQVDSAVEVVEKTYDADNAIYNYEWFKSQYEKIEANRNQIQNTIDSIDGFKQTYGNVSSWDYDTNQEYNRLSAMKLSLQNMDENLVADYNARSKMANREVFKDKLPLSVDKIIW